MSKIVGIGETVLDIIFKNGSPTAAVPGGSTFNALISLGRTLKGDAEVVMVTDTGDDRVGDIEMDFMEKNNVSTYAVSRNKGCQSCVSLAFLNENNDASYEFFKDSNVKPLSGDDVDIVDFGKDDIVLFGSFFATNPALRDFVKGLLLKARRAGATVYYDINFRKNHIPRLAELMGFIEENCRLADFVRGSSEDFTYLYGTSDGGEVYGRIAPMCKNLILTRGGDPVEIYDPSGSYAFAVPQVETVSTIGAGDNFNAGFIYGLFRGGLVGKASLEAEDWRALVATATAFSSAVCQSVFNYVDEGFEI